MPNELEELKQEIENLKNWKIENQKKDCEEIIQTIDPAFESGDVLSERASNSLYDLKKDSTYSKLKELANPTKNILGFSFVEIIIKNAEDLLTEKIEKRPKNLFNNILDRTLNIPLINSLTTIHPIGRLVQTAVESARTFAFPKLKALGFSISQGLEFDDTQIDDFESAIKPYVSFYESYSRRVENHHNILNELIERLETVHGQSKDYYKRLLKALEINSSNAQPEYRELLQLSNNDYAAFLNNTRIKKGYLIAQRFPILLFQVNQARIETLQANKKFLNNIKNLIIDAHQDDDMVTDEALVHDIIVSINETIKNTNYEIDRINNGDYSSEIDREDSIVFGFIGKNDEVDNNLIATVNNIRSSILS